MNNMTETYKLGNSFIEEVHFDYWVLQPLLRKRMEPSLMVRDHLELLFSEGDIYLKVIREIYPKESEEDYPDCDRFIVVSSLIPVIFERSCPFIDEQGRPQANDNAFNKIKEESVSIFNMISKKHAKLIQQITLAYASEPLVTLEYFLE